MERIIGKKEDGPEVNNITYAYRLQTVADGLRDADRNEEAEKLYRRCQTMVGSIFGEDHPCILSYNGNIITCLSVKLNKKDKSEEEKAELRKVVEQIIHKN